MKYIFFIIGLSFIYTGYSQNYDELLNLALSKYGSGELIESVELYGKAIGLKPENPNAYLGRATSLKELENYSAALVDFNKAEKLGAAGTMIYADRGYCKKQLNDYSGALKDLDKAVELKPGDYTAYNTRGLVKKETGKPEDALKDFDKATSLHERYAEAWLNKGVIYYESGKAEEASQCFIKATAMNIAYSEAYYYNGLTLLYLKKDFTGAIAQFDKTLLFDKTADYVYPQRGYAKAEKTDYAGAIADYSKSVELNPGYAEGYFSLGLLKISTGLKEEACGHLKKAEEMGYEKAKDVLEEYCK